MGGFSEGEEGRVDDDRRSFRRDSSEASAGRDRVGIVQGGRRAVESYMARDTLGRAGY